MFVLNIFIFINNTASVALTRRKQKALTVLFDIKRIDYFIIKKEWYVIQLMNDIRE